MNILYKLIRMYNTSEYDIRVPNMQNITLLYLNVELFYVCCLKHFHYRSTLNRISFTQGNHECKRDV